MLKPIGDLAIHILKEEINEIEYSKYFKSIRFNEQHSNKDTYIYEVPNIFILKWIQTKYGEKIAHIIESETGQKVSVQITANAKAGHNSATQQMVSKKIPGKKKLSTILNPSLTFDNFVVGDSNQFAFSSAKDVAQNPGIKHNPFFIYGGVGLGKTHLMQSIGNFNYMDYNILCLTTEQLMNDFTKHIANNSMSKFREIYRGCDILLIDDVQFLSGKDRFQEEFFHTFEDLSKRDKQIVLTADKKPSEISGLEERLKSRFLGGLTTHIQPPDLETKIGIIRKKCELDGISLSHEIILYIATHLETNIREIEGILIKINAYANLINQQVIDFDFAKNILKEHIKEKKENTTIEDIIKVVTKELNIKPSEITSKSRKQKNRLRQKSNHLFSKTTHSRDYALISTIL